MAGAFLSGLLGGFSDSAAASRKAAADDAEKKSAREDSILHLMATSDDPEIQQAALAGLTDTTPRKKGFLDNLVGGKYEPNPALGHIAALIKAGKEIPAQAGPIVGGVNLPAGPPTISAPPAAIPTGESAAMPATSAVQAPPPVSALPQPTAAAVSPPPAMNALPAASTTLSGQPARTVPRQVFDTSEEKIRKDVLAKSQADVEGEVAGLMAAGADRATALKSVLAKKMGVNTDLPRFMGNVQGKDLPPGSVDASGRPVGVESMYRHVLQSGASRYEPITSITASHHTYREGVMVDGAPWLVEVLPNGGIKPIAKQAERDQNIPVTHEDGSQEIVRVPASFSGGTGAPPQSTPTAPTQGAATSPSAGVTPPPGPPAAGAPSKAGSIQTRPAQYKAAYARMPSGAVRSVSETPDGKMVDPSTKQPVEGAIASTPALAAAHQDAMTRLGTINSGLKEIEDLTKQVYPAGGGLLGGLKAGAAITAKNLTRDPTLGKLRSRVTMASGPIARVIEMSNRMNLTQVKQAAEALGNPDKGLLGSSSQEEALAKIQAVRDALNDATDQMGIVIDPTGQPHQFDTRAQMDAFKARIAAHTGGR